MDFRGISIDENFFQCTSQESDAEHLVRSQWYYLLENSFKWLHHDRRTVRSATGLGY